MFSSVQSARAPYACDPAHGRGRLHPEPPSPTRTGFQRDRDRIIHSTAFRRLMYKTQVFIYHEGDHFRTRLTHTLEVSQLARALARSLRVDEDLAEAVALAHDLGHPPFGHAGERALNRAMAPYNGFDHNAQSLRAVTRLEHRYAEFDGLNLTWEALEGIVKHNGPLVDGRGRAVGPYRDSGVPLPILDYCRLQDLEIARYAGVEAQAAAIADDIAYNSHDVDDGLRAGLFTIADVEEGVPFLAGIVADVRMRYPDIEDTRLIHETTRRVITWMVEDALAESLRRIERLAPGSVADVRAADAPIVAFSDAMTAAIEELRAFLFARMYRHGRVMAVMSTAEAAVVRMFEELLARPERMPQDWGHSGDVADIGRRARLVADYIAGMTDRFALSEYQRLFDETLDLR
ncbi:deoxyguanosinetriphosphate triphosphohydrolase [Microbaculum marinum]|uniref:Deoxyguanosinetriphosphate triphosphohydrolase-like protein n=1 Tax=Microbaculum marinum TaxID=1764581 RepID=A0AAW9RUA9_9HYPH